MTADVFKLWPSRTAICDPQTGLATSEFIKALGRIATLFGGQNSTLPVTFIYIPLSGTPYGVAYLAADGSLTSTLAPTDGQFLIGRTGLSPVLGTLAGVSNRTTVTLSAGGVAVDISATYVGQTSITTVGTIGTGIWQGTTIGAAYGGTGQATYTIGDILYASGTTTLSVLADVAAGNALISGGVGVAPAWGKIGLTTHVSGTLAATNGGTGQSSYAVGDLLYASTTTALSKLADVAIGNVLRSGGVGVAPAWGKTDLTTDVTGTLPVANGGTGVTAPSGTYTPTLTNVANLDASTAYQCQYIRVGSVVTVSGKVDINPTLASTSTQLGISLPVASNLGAAEDCAGVAFASGIAAQGAAILGDATNNRAQLEYIAADITNQPMYFQFQYEII